VRIRITSERLSRLALLTVAFSLLVAVLSRVFDIFATQTPDSGSHLSFTLSTAWLWRIEWLSLVVALLCLSMGLWLGPAVSRRFRPIVVGLTGTLSLGAFAFGLLVGTVSLVDGAPNGAAAVVGASGVVGLIAVARAAVRSSRVSPSGARC